MQRLIGSLGSITASARQLIQRGSSREDRRQAFHHEFGKYPAHFEATPGERSLFASEVVHPVLVRRARAIDERMSAPNAQVGHATTDPGPHDDEGAFRRAYQLAVELNLADKGLTYRDFLIAEVRPSQESVIV
jgi:hypothetical protein